MLRAGDHKGTEGYYDADTQRSGGYYDAGDSKGSEGYYDADTQGSSEGYYDAGHNKGSEGYYDANDTEGTLISYTQNSPVAV